VSPHSWEESTGLLSSLIPQPNGTASFTNAQAFNTSKGDLKLGPFPITEELRTESERVLREQAMVERDPSAQYEIQFPRPVTLPGIVAPLESDLLPHPTSFKSVDVEREVKNVRDARKRIRLEPSVLANIDVNSPQAGNLRARALPSICAYSLHDVAEG
jgi:transcription initiation factor TFIID subunit 5